MRIAWYHITRTSIRVIALGTAEVSPLELTSAYGVYPNEGVLVSPIAITRIEDNDGNVIEDNSRIKKKY